MKKLVLSLVLGYTLVLRADSVTLPDAMYTLYLQSSPGGYSPGLVTYPMPAALPSSSFAGGGTSFTYSGSSGGSLDQVEIGGGHTAPLAYSGSVQVDAQTFYALSITQTAPTAIPIANVPVLLHATASVNCTGSGSGTAFVSVVDVSANVFQQKIACGGSFDVNTSALFGVNDLVFVNKAATGYVQVYNANEQYQGTVESMADPAFQIDPAFQYANDFTIQYSENYGDLPAQVSATPEPSSAALASLGVVSLLTVVRSKRRRSRAH